MMQIVVLEYSTSRVIMYEVPDNLSEKECEEFLYKNHRMGDIHYMIGKVHLLHQNISDEKPKEVLLVEKNAVKFKI